MQSVVVYVMPHKKMNVPEPKIVLQIEGIVTEIAFVDINQGGQIAAEIIKKFEKLKAQCVDEIEFIPDWYIPYCEQTLSLLEAINSNYHTGTQDFHLLLCLYQIEAIEEELDRTTSIEIQEIMFDIKHFVASNILKRSYNIPKITTNEV